MKPDEIIKKVSEGQINNAFSSLTNWVNSIEPIDDEVSNEKRKLTDELDTFRKSKSSEDLQKWIDSSLMPVLNKYKTKERHYESSKLPIFDDNGIPPDKKFELLKEVYKEASSNYKNLADIRFKLLGLVPAVSVLTWIQLYKDIQTDSIIGLILGLVLSLIAIRITYGIRTYDKRNDELYNDLISRGRRAEYELGINTGIFKGRLEASNTDMFNKKINHGRALDLIYSSVFIGWILQILWFSMNLVLTLKK